MREAMRPGSHSLKQYDYGGPENAPVHSRLVQRLRTRNPVIGGTRETLGSYFMNATVIQIVVPVEPIQLFCVQQHEDHIPTFPKKSSDGRMITNQFLFQTVKVRNICD